MGPPAKRRKTTTTAIPEIEFDDSARADYLSGFHKRKVERAKHAKESAKKKEREERIRDRADVCFSGIPNVWTWLTILTASKTKERGDGGTRKGSKCGDHGADWTD